MNNFFLVLHSVALGCLLHRPCSMYYSPFHPSVMENTWEFGLFNRQSFGSMSEKTFNDLLDMTLGVHFFSWILTTKKNSVKIAENIHRNNVILVNSFSQCMALRKAVDSALSWLGNLQVVPSLLWNINFSFPAPEPVTPMIPPVGLKAIVLSATTIVVTWSDTTLGRNQRITDNRYYTIRYAPRPMARRFKYVNSTDLNVHIDDLRPNTEYEFSVKVIKGQRKSTWSLSVFNKTFEAGKSAYHYCTWL